MKRKRYTEPQIVCALQQAKVAIAKPARVESHMTTTALCRQLWVLEDRALQLRASRSLIGQGLPHRRVTSQVQF